MIGVEAGVGEAEALDWAAMEDVFADNLVYVLEFDEAVPDGLGVNDDGGAVLALVEAAGLVGSDGVFETGGFEGVFEGVFEFLAAAGAATGARGGVVALVGADKDVVFELCHGAESFGVGKLVCGASCFLRQWMLDAT
jgi:hypothetical protein